MTTGLFKTCKALVQHQHMQMEFHFRRHFRLRPKMTNAFRSASSIHHKKVLVMLLQCFDTVGWATGRTYLACEKLNGGYWTRALHVLWSPDIERMCVCLCVCGSVTTLTRNLSFIDPHQTGFVGKGSDHIQLIKFWPSRAPSKGDCSRAKFGTPNNF